MTILKGRKPPLICGVMVGSIDIGAAVKAKKDGAAIVELRVDTFKERDPLRLKKKLRDIRPYKIPLILTIRSKKEGGWFTVSDRERMNLFEALIPHAACVDIEISSANIIRRVVELAKEYKKEIICSYHNFKITPSERELIKVIKKARASGADIVKIATTAKEKSDIKKLLNVLFKHKDVAVLAMGKYGMSTRVFFPLFGSLIAYGSITKQTAPGQISLKELKRMISFFSKN